MQVFGNEYASSAGCVSVCRVFGNENVMSARWLLVCWVFGSEYGRSAERVSVFHKKTLFSSSFPEDK